MKKTFYLSIAFTFAMLCIMASAEADQQATFTIPGDFPTLQSANDSAIVAPGSTIRIEADTPGATITKRLVIEGTKAAVVGAAFFGSGEGTEDIRFTGIALTSGASGTIIRNVVIGANSLLPAPPFFGIFTGGAVRSAASNITITGCTINQSFQGISGSCGVSDDGVVTTCPRNWRVENNTILLNTQLTPLNAYVGISGFNGARDWVITRNTITRPNTEMAGATERVYTGGTGITSFATYGDRVNNISITDNRCAVRGFFDYNMNRRFDAGEESGTAIEVTAGSYGDLECCGLAFNNNTTVTGNDERGSDFRTSVFASRDPADTNNDLARLHQYDYLVFDLGRVNTVMIRGNINPAEAPEGRVARAGGASSGMQALRQRPAVPFGF